MSQKKFLHKWSGQVKPMLQRKIWRKMIFFRESGEAWGKNNFLKEMITCPRIVSEHYPRALRPAGSEDDVHYGAGHHHHRHEHEDQVPEQ